MACTTNAAPSCRKGDRIPMFNQLIESKRKRQRSIGGSLFSLVAHGVLILAAVKLTTGVTDAAQKKDQKVEFVEIKKPDEPPPPPKKEAPPPPDAPVTPPPPKGFQTLSPPLEIPNIVPPIDITRKVTNEADFSAKGVKGGVSTGVVGGTGPVEQETPYLDFQVEKQAEPAPNQDPPKYPEVLRTAGVEGTVEAQFVVDTTGHADLASFKSMNGEANQLFVKAVKDCLAKARYYPAEIGGKKVRQLVQQQFNFTIKR
jgi:periplasmic protein TonB